MTKFDGHYTVALKRARAALKAAGVALGKKHGRYSAFGGTQFWTPGVMITRIGLSDSIHVWYVNPRPGYGGDAERREHRERVLEAVVALRAAGLPFDDHGSMDCSPSWARRGSRPLPGGPGGK